MASSRTVYPSRGAQRVSFGLGHHFVSPKKLRDKNKTQKSVEVPGMIAKRRRLLAQMEQLMNPKPKDTTNEVHAVEAEVISNMDDVTEIPDLGNPGDSPSTLLSEDSRDKRRITPDKSMDTLYASWKALIPTLIDLHLKYSARTLAMVLETLPKVISACSTVSCAQKRTQIVCLFFDSQFSHLLACPMCIHCV